MTCWPRRRAESRASGRGSKVHAPSVESRVLRGERLERIVRRQFVRIALALGCRGYHVQFDGKTQLVYNVVAKFFALPKEATEAIVA